MQRIMNLIVNIVGNHAGSYYRWRWKFLILTPSQEKFPMCQLKSNSSTTSIGIALDISYIDYQDGSLHPILQ
jgi:hypothetical protein